MSWLPDRRRCPIGIVIYRDGKDGYHTADDYHNFWGCPATEDIDIQDVQRTQRLGKYAERHVEAIPLYWLCGIIKKTNITPDNTMPPYQVDTLIGDLPRTSRLLI